MSNSNRKIVYKAMQTPDGTILETKHNHDYAAYIDKNGKRYSIDGGREEISWSEGSEDCKFTIIYADDEFDVVRKYFKWGSRKDNFGNVLPKINWITLSDISDDYLDTLCSYEAASQWARILFIKEKQFRQLANELF